MTVSIDIRNQHNLYESLEQYVKGDLLEGANAYHCDKCNKKVPHHTTRTHSTLIRVCVVAITGQCSCKCNACAHVHVHALN